MQVQVQVQVRVHVQVQEQVKMWLQLQVKLFVEKTDLHSGLVIEGWKPSPPGWLHAHSQIGSI